MSKLKAHRKRALELVGPIIDERLREFAENQEKTNDLPVCIPFPVSVFPQNANVGSIWGTT